MGAIQGFFSVVGRVLLVAIFLLSAVNKIGSYGNYVKLIESEGVPQPGILLAIAIAFLIGGGLMVLTGFQGRFGALLLAVFLGTVSYYIHDFWTFTPEKVAQTHPWVEKLSEEEKNAFVGHVQQQEMISFLKNAALLGAMVFIVGNGTGAWSIEGGSKDDTRPKRQGDF